MKRVAVVAGIAVLLALVAGQAEAKIDWLHVHVDEGGSDPNKVRVNVPVSMVAAILPVIDEAEFHDGKVQLDDHEVNRAQIHAILKAVAMAEEGEYVTVESWCKHKHEQVRVAKNSGTLILHVIENGRHPSTVKARIPISVVEALISGKEDELDVVAAVEALRKAGDAEIVVTDSADDTRVRIWVDTKAMPERI
jgi:hypothetical protein